jgi:tetratricopeptide (TPR) repeat protein
MWRGVLLAIATLAPGGDQSPPPAADCAPAAGEQQRGDAVARYRAGRDLVLAQKWAEAVDPLLAGVRLDPRLPLAHYSLGEAYMALERYPQALQAFLGGRLAYRCSASPEERARAQRLLDEEIRDLRYAIRLMERDRLVSGAIGLKEVNKDSRIPMGESLRVIQDMENRLAELVAARKRDALDEPPELAFAIGNAYFHIDALADAAREFEAALARRPRWGDAHNNLALVLMLTGRLDEAEREVKLAEMNGVEVSPRLKDEIRKRGKLPR